MSKADYKYKFSFVMPVYNVENYLAETIESVLAQTMDFEENVEIILINDGSPDNSEEVCLRYQQQFPENIKYIKQKNQGVSAARNRGIEEARGKYITFLDSDDKLSPDTLQEVYDFFEQNYNEIDFVSIKLVFFESRVGDHPLNYKFETTRIIDVTKEYDKPQLSSASAFIKHKVLAQGGYRFPLGITHSEDARFMSDILQEKHRYGVVAGATYYYRRRSRENSAINSSYSSLSWYFDTPTKVYKYLLDKAKGPSAKYLQYLVMYDLQWRLRQQDISILEPEQIKSYKKVIASLLALIDDQIIVDQLFITTEHKIYALNLKYKRDIRKSLLRDGLNYYYNQVNIYSYQTIKPPVHIEFIDLCSKGIEIEGYFNGFLFNDAELVFIVEDKEYKPQSIQRTKSEVRILNELVYDRNSFKLSATFKPGSSLRAFLRVGPEIFPLRIITHQFTRLSQLNAHTYRISSGMLLIKTPHELIAQKYTPLRHAYRELRYILSLIKMRKLYSVGIRLLACVVKLRYSSRPLYLISDRITAAGDNGEALFRYLQSVDTGGAKIIFTISKKSPDYKRIKSYGTVIDRDSFRYKLLFLACSHLVSSHADNFVINPFNERQDDLVDLYSFKFIFLQHGIIKDDLSTWLNKQQKNIHLFVTSARPEYDSVIEGKYNYDKKVIRLTGLPRYDYLDNNPTGKLIIAPTWRHNLTLPADTRTGIRPYLDDFKHSDYYRFYQELMHHPGLSKLLKENNMTGEFYLHPALTQQACDFIGNEVFTIASMPYDYGRALSEGDILVTDFSSVAFDFAYLKKPVVYAQFDQDTFYQNHLYKEDYFKYNQHGLGPVVYNVEGVVEEIIKIIQNGCRPTKTYLSRINSFFYKFDTKNSQRVYESIKELDNDS